MAALSVDGTPMPALPNSADQINYDNTTSGLSATTVKGAVDELASEKQDKTDNSLTTTNKTIVGGINELRSGLTNVDVALSVPDGAGKNLLPMTLASLKARNTSGTWVDNVYTLGNVSCTVNTDSTGAVTSLQTTAASTGEKNFVLYVDVTLKKGSYILSSGFNETYRYKDTLLTVSGGTVIARGNSEAPGQSFTLDSTVNATLALRVKVDEDITAYLMIRPATITDPTFAPYIPSVESRIEAVEVVIHRKVAESATSGTYADKLNSLYSAYNALTALEKHHSYIIFAANIVPLMDVSNIIFASALKYTSGSTAFNGYSAKLAETGSTMHKIVAGSTGNTISELSSTSNSDIFYLYV